ncbi:MAG: YfhO family protein [Lachnospiraceae bacterium]|nr:YfhO family protein [Lachnospiraceae bacterium]
MVFVFCFWSYLSTGTSFIWSGDGWDQHYKALLYYRDYLREIASNLFSLHRTGIPDWDFTIGEGNDILNTFHYYVIGDPFAFLCVFVPKAAMAYFYSFLCVLRLYLAGLSFLALCFYRGHKNRYGMLTAALSYVFCMWGIINCARHPYFLNPLIYFPLLILGVEKILSKERPLLYMALVAVSALSNFYFFYMYVILLAVYIVLRLIFFCKKDWKMGLLLFGKLSLYSVIGVCMAGVILLPVLSMLLSDSRMSLSQPFHLLYSLKYYSTLPAMGVSNSWLFWTCIGFSTPVYPAVFLLFSKKKDRSFLKLLLVICLFLILFPIGGRLLNGMSYVTNRWVFAFSLLCAYILSDKWEDLLHIGKKETVLLSGCSLVYYLLVLFLERSRTKGALSEMVLFFVLILILSAVTRDHLRQLGVLLSGAFGMVLVSLYAHSLSIGSGYVDTCLRYEDIDDEWENNEAAALRKNVSGTEWIRYSGRDLVYNANIFHDCSSSNYFWTLSNPHVNEFRQDLAMHEPLYQMYRDYDDRTAVMALSAVNYYTLREDQPKCLPYGYELVWEGDADTTFEERKAAFSEELGTAELTEEQEEKLRSVSESPLKIYKNLNTLAPAYVYHAAISKDAWERMDPVQKQEAMLEAAYVEDPASSGSDGLDLLEKMSGNISLSEGELPDYSVSYGLEPASAEVTVSQGKIVTTAKNAKVTLTTEEPIKNAEIYVAVTGLKYDETEEYELYFGDESVDPLNLYSRSMFEDLSEKEQYRIKNELFLADYTDENATIQMTLSGGGTKKLNYLQEEAIPSSSRHDFAVNLGYYEEKAGKIVLTFAGRGVYTFDSLTVYVVSMDGYEEKIQKLGKDPVENLEFATDRVSLNTTLTEAGVLCVATPYSKGWTVTVDGKEADILCVNKRYLGVFVPEGDHRVSFHYHLPYKKAGALVSIFGMPAFLAAAVFACKAKRGMSQ